MFEKIKVLIVDDSAFMRKVISDMVSSQPDMEVVDTARDGEMAVQKAALYKPDVITLDVEMPKKNGLEALREIRQICTSQVIMLSSLTSEGSAITIDALRIGAFDFIQKPSGSISLDIAKVKDELMEKIRYAKAHGRKNSVSRNHIPISHSVKPSQPPAIKGRTDCLLIGASTGGPKVLFDIITALPGDLNIPVFIVQHMPAGFTKAFAERIDKNARLKVIEARDGERIEANKVYIAPGGYHMLVEAGSIKLDLSPQIHGVRPAVDKLFISACEVYKNSILSCVLTGMGKDGAEGVRHIKSKGGYVIAQDESTSTVYGMPKAAFETGCVDMVLPEDRIAEEMIKIIKKSPSGR